MLFQVTKRILLHINLLCPPPDMAQQSQKQHLWLSQVEISGIVFSEPVLADSAPEGFRILEKN